MDYEDFVKAIREEEEMSKAKSLTRKKMKRSDKLQAEGQKRMVKKNITREATDFSPSVAQLEAQHRHGCCGKC